MADLRPDVTWQRRDGGPGFLFDGRSGAVFGLNATAETVLEAMAAGKEPAALLAKRFDVTPQAAKRDAAAFLDLLKEYELVAD